MRTQTNELKVLLGDTEIHYSALRVEQTECPYVQCIVRSDTAPALRAPVVVRLGDAVLFTGSVIHRVQARLGMWELEAESDSYKLHTPLEAMSWNDSTAEHILSDLCGNVDGVLQARHSDTPAMKAEWDARRILRR